MATHSSIHIHAKRFYTVRGAPPCPTPGQKVSNMLLGKRRRQLLKTPERMKWLGQSRKDTQLWMCVVVKVIFDAVKNNIT